MLVEERIVREAAHRVESEPGTGDAAWFAVRQPGIVRYLDARCGPPRASPRQLAEGGAAGDEGMGVALLAALAIHAAYERALGGAPPRVASAALERAEQAVAGEAARDLTLARQPALAEFVAAVVAAPPVELADEAVTRVGLALLAVVYALDEAITGRRFAIPA
jgi:hypothetical protein